MPKPRQCLWARLDSNQEPTPYEAISTPRTPVNLRCRQLPLETKPPARCAFRAFHLSLPSHH